MFRRKEDSTMILGQGPLICGKLSSTSGIVSPGCESLAQS